MIVIIILVVLAVVLLLLFTNNISQKAFNVILITALIVIFLFVSGTVKAQKDTAKIVVPPDSIPVISTRQFDQFYKYLRENVSVSTYEKLTPDKVLQMFFEWSVIEWNRRKK